jgi:hypothetical protein
VKCRDRRIGNLNIRRFGAANHDPRSIDGESGSFTWPAHDTDAQRGLSERSY